MPLIFLPRVLLILLILALVPAAQAFSAPRILILGDSISAAYGMEVDQGWVALLQQRLLAEGYPHRVVNASISGETTGGGRSRLAKLLTEHEPELLILELGGNDGLRGLPLSRMQSNLRAMTENGQQSGACVLLVGMRLPPNYGPAFTEAFAAVYPAVASATDAPLLPFLLEGIDETGLQHMQADGVHPGAKLQPLMLDNIWLKLEPLLEKLEATASSR